MSPDRQMNQNVNMYQRQGSSFAKSEWQHSSNAPTQPAGAPNTDIVRGLENGILSLHNHLKTLEGKYIDLANYYKQELIQANQTGPGSSKNGAPGSEDQAQMVAGI